MDCPNCGFKMERQDDVEFDGLKEHPMADYTCGECGYHLQWRLSGTVVVFDPRRDNEPIWASEI